MEFKGITVGTYISRKPKNNKEKDVCANCKIYEKIQTDKHIDKEKEYELCKNCEKCYVSKTCKALLTVGRDQTTGKTNRKTFVADSEEQALNDALQYKLDLNKVIYMLAVHELEEIEIGDLAFYETTKEDKLEKGKNATDLILKDLIGKEEISKLLDEYNERKTDEAIFAYHCDKLECDVQMKLYDQEGCFDLNNQPNNPIIDLPSVKKVLDSESSISNAWIEFDRSKFEDDPVFIEIINWLKDNNI